MRFLQTPTFLVVLAQKSKLNLQVILDGGGADERLDHLLLTLSTAKYSGNYISRDNIKLIGLSVPFLWLAMFFFSS